MAAYVCVVSDWRPVQHSVYDQTMSRVLAWVKVRKSCTVDTDTVPYSGRSRRFWWVNCIMMAVATEGNEFLIFLEDNKKDRQKEKSEKY